MSTESTRPKLGRPFEYNNTIIEQALALHAQGFKLRAIAKQVGAGKSTVARWITAWEMTQHG